MRPSLRMRTSNGPSTLSLLPVPTEEQKAQSPASSEIFPTSAPIGPGKLPHLVPNENQLAGSCEECLLISVGVTVDGDEANKRAIRTEISGFTSSVQVLIADLEQDEPEQLNGAIDQAIQPQQISSSGLKSGVQFVGRLGDHTVEGTPSHIITYNVGQRN